jgi:hypothetical protein
VSQGRKSLLQYSIPVLSLLLFAVISIHSIPVAAQTGTQVSVFPQSISFNFLSGDSIKEDEQRIYFSANQNTDVIQYNFTDLRSTTDGIDAGSLELSQSAFRITNTTLTTVTAKIKLMGAYDPGSYKGRLMLFTNNSLIASIDTEVKIQDLLVETNIITIDPKSVTFHFRGNDAIADAKPIEITTTRALANVTASFVPFGSKDGVKSIPEDVFTLEPSTFDLITSESKTVRLIIRSTDYVQSGTYEGYLKFSSGNVIQRLPITVTIDKPTQLSRWEPILPVAIGISVSVVLSLLKEGYKIKEEVRQSFNKAWVALFDAARERRDYRLALGYQSIVEGVRKLIFDEFHEARDLFIEAKEKLDKATKDPPQIPLIPDPALADEVSKRLKGLLSLTASFSKEKILVIIFGIVVATASLAILQGISGDILDFDNVFADSVAAFLFGFGSQALVNQIAPVIARKL